VHKLFVCLLSGLFSRALLDVFSDRLCIGGLSTGRQTDISSPFLSYPIFSPSGYPFFTAVRFRCPSRENVVGELRRFRLAEMSGLRRAFRFPSPFMCLSRRFPLSFLDRRGLSRQRSAFPSLSLAGLSFGVLFLLLNFCVMSVR